MPDVCGATTHAHQMQYNTESSPRGKDSICTPTEKRNSNFTCENPFYSYINSKSEYGFDIPDVSMFGMLKISEKNHPEAVAIDYFGRKFTYNKLVGEIERISHSYYKIGVRKGDIVTVLMPNTPEGVLSIYALNRLGAISNIVHPLSAQEEIKNYLVSCKCKFLLCIDKCIKKIENIKEETKKLNEYQQISDSPELCSLIPHLSSKDLELKIENDTIEATSVGRIIVCKYFMKSILNALDK